MQGSVMSFLGSQPFAHAYITGDAAHPSLRGYVDFFRYKNGTVMLAEIWDLPHNTVKCADNIFAMHIHSGGSCEGNMDMSFSEAGGHYDTSECPHPSHTGDLPPLFGNNGYAWCGFYTERFIPGELIGKTVIIHSKRDDFTTQPAGDSGNRIGCGVITAMG